MSRHNGPNIVTNGLVLYLDAANRQSYPGSGTNWYDAAGSSISGSLINGPTFDSANGGSIVFDGVNDYINSTPLSSPGPPITVETFCKFNDSPSDTNNFRYIFSLGNNVLGEMISLSKSKTVSPAGTLQPNQGYIYLGGGQDDGLRNIDYIFTGSLYHHVAIQVLPDNQTLKCYIDGAEVGVQSNTQSISLGSTLNLGRWFYPLWYLTGNISTFRIYNRALSQSEVLQNYNATKARYGL